MRQDQTAAARRPRMIKLAVAALMAFTVATPSAPPRAQAAEKVVKFEMPYLECFQTTEHGEDEVYLVVTGKWDTGETFQYRYPKGDGGDAHWDLNDGEGDPPVEDWPLINLTMRDGDSVDIVVMVMEEDGGTSGGWTALAGTAVGVVNKGAGSVIAAVGKLLIIRDSDDFIGAFSVHIKNDGGDILPSFKARDRVTRICDADKYWERCPVDMNGDGSNYRSLFSVK